MQAFQSKLPVVFRPHTDEALSSWLVRIAGVYRFDLAALTSECLGWLPDIQVKIRDLSAARHWAWAINGCASVVAGPLATLLALGAGLPIVLLVASACYAVAALLAGTWQKAFV